MGHCFCTLPSIMVVYNAISKIATNFKTLKRDPPKLSKYIPKTLIVPFESSRTLDEMI